MFGKKKSAKDTVLLVDIENASVGVALTHLTPGGAPILFAEHRTELAIPQRLQSTSIAKQIEHAAHQALAHLSLVAARLRGHDTTFERGELTKAAVFLGAPWGTPNLAEGKAQFSPQLQKFLTEEIDAIAPQAQLSFYTGADAAVFGNTIQMGETTLLAIVRGEITELVMIGKDGVLGYGTVPVGARSLYRTLQTHAGLSSAEIPSIMRLAHNDTNPYLEPLNAAGRHIIEQFAPGVEAIAHSGTPGGVVVVAEEPLAGWFARNLESDESLGSLFRPNATVRTLGSKHLASRLGGHVSNPDLHLALGALFMHGKTLPLFSGV